MLLRRISERLLLSKAKHASLAGHARIARWLARQVPFYEYDGDELLSSDAAPAELVERRRAALRRVAAIYAERYRETARLSAELEQGLSDLRFTAAYRVPFQYRAFVRRHFPPGAFIASSSGVKLTDPDGNVAYDLGGSYGVNVFGYDFYKAWMQRALERMQALGPVLGAYHPLIVDNVRWLKAISGQDEVSFHMSGTEAVMQAVRLARYHTRRPQLVRFCGAYHGWWGDVQPGVGNPLPPDATSTLADVSSASLEFLRASHDVACVLVNPLQALHPNADAPSDSTLVGTRSAHFDRAAYTSWLERLRAVCSERGIVLIFDEVLVGFRLARGGAQEYFGVRADLVTYGKTVGGGFPIGVLCGRAELMKRFRDLQPADICFARGTFNSHPYVMAAMHEFLQHLNGPEAAELYARLEAVWSARAEQLNARLGNESLPVRVAALSTIWTVCYLEPSRYNWLLQYYLRAEGLALSWVGTGRILFSFNYNDADFAEVSQRFVAAARAMRDDGFFWSDPVKTSRSLKRGLLRELVVQRIRAARRQPARLVSMPSTSSPRRT